MHTTTICKGITLSGVPCNRRIKETGKTLCHQHKVIFRQAKPEECIICYESLANQKRSLDCGHWIHKQCIIKSAKAECTICRKKLNLGALATQRIKELAIQRSEEQLIEEEQELIALENTRSNLIDPELQERIHDIVSNILEYNDTIDAIDVIVNIFDDQDFLYNLLNNLIGNTDTGNDDTDAMDI